MQLRRHYLSKPLLSFYRRVMPAISRTEKEALNAGTVGWEGDLFSGKLDWNKLRSIAKPKLSVEEESFINGPLETLCGMIDDWDISHHKLDLPLNIWNFIREQGFFGLLIPKEYGGKGFSHYACSQIQIKIQARSVTLGTTVSVPNSLGPAELLLHYGTEEQKKHYLPRLAKGEEIPCFALTSSYAGSDATAMTDYGIVCHEKEGGKIGIRLNFNKRYITLAPVATVIGLAFKLYDPDHLLGDKEEIGITCALIPRTTKGITIGRRHFPLNAPFQNGPIQGHDVFIPLEWIIGGPEQAGQGWRMLMECLAGGRGLSLPALVTGGAKAAVLATSAYSRIRRQFKQPIARFEGVSEIVAKMAANLYTMEASRLFILSALDNNEKPAVASAIIKYHATEKGRQIGNEAMDVHGGKGIILGPKNILGRAYQAIPIAITVEGANILTRNMIIFGQGAMRCHPFLYQEYEAALSEDKEKRLLDFDRAFWGHIKFISKNFIRTFWLGLTSGFFIRTPESKMKRYYQHLNRLASAFALLADISILANGSQLKRKESISARLGDILSQLYMSSAILNHYYHNNEPEEELPLACLASKLCFYEAQQAFNQVLANSPFTLLWKILQWVIFPWGKPFSMPKFALSEQVAQLFSSPSETRARLINDVLLDSKQDSFSNLENAFAKVIESEPIEKVLSKTINLKTSLLSINDAAKIALERGIITQQQYELCLEAENYRQQVIAVDDFANEELLRK